MYKNNEKLIFQKHNMIGSCGPSLVAIRIHLHVTINKTIFKKLKNRASSHLI